MNPIPQECLGTVILWMFFAYTTGFVAALLAARNAGHLRPKETP